MSLLLVLGGSGPAAPVASRTVTWAVQVDWDRDGDFDQAIETLSGVLGIEWSTGRDGSNAAPMPASAGSATITLKNLDGRYSPDNGASPLTGLLRPNRTLRITAGNGLTTETLWQGFIDTITPQASVASFPTATITAVGPFAWLAGRLVTLPSTTGRSVSDLIDDVLDAAGWPATDRTISASNVTTGRHTETRGEWQPPTGGIVAFARVNALDALRRLEDMEPFGFLYESNDGKIVFEDRDYRTTTARCTASQTTFTDDPNAEGVGYQGIAVDDAWAHIINQVMVRVNTWSVAAASVRWTHPAPLPSLAQYGTLSLVSRSDGLVESWVTPVIGTDIVAADAAHHELLAQTVQSYGSTEMRWSIFNGNTATVSFTTLQARGSVLTANDPLDVLVEDTTSQDEFGLRPQQFEAYFYPSHTLADAYAEQILAWYKDPHPFVTVTFIAEATAAALTAALARRLSDRVTLTATGTRTEMAISGDFYVEAISGRARSPGLLEMSLTLSPVRPSILAMGVTATAEIGTPNLATLGTLGPGGVDLVSTVGIPSLSEGRM